MKNKQDKMIDLGINNALIQQMLLDNKDKIVGYIRVSKYQDNEKEIQRQENTIIDFCKWCNVDCKHIYIDNGFSGLDFNRPGIKEILNKKEKMVLIMFSIGRLTRSYELMQDYIKNTNISVISINDGFIIKNSWLIRLV